MKEKFYWKVVKKSTSGLYQSLITSFISNDYDNNPFLLYYNIGQITVPRYANSKIFVFNTRQQARKWIKSDGMINYKILKCRVTNPTLPIKISECTKRNMAAFWNGEHCLDSVPVEGTIFVDSCTPIELSR